MKTKAAVLWGINQKWEVEEVDLDGPKEDEVLVKLTACGLCHSDPHVVTGVAEGDHVVMSFLPACGRCKPCARGMSNLCDLGAKLFTGTQLDGTCRVHARGHDIGQLLLVGTFAEYTVVPTASVVKGDDSGALDKASVLSCVET